MSGLKSSLSQGVPKHKSVNHGITVNKYANPFDSDDDELDSNQTIKNPVTASNLSTNPFDDGDVKGTSSSQIHLSPAAENRYKKDFTDCGGFENRAPLQELEEYAVSKAEETTKTVNNCLKIAEGIREDASRTLVNLHQQGEQITRTHMVAADMDRDLTRGEKLLGSLGGIFSKTWKPKMTRQIIGPTITKDYPVLHRTGNQLEQRERLGLTSSAPKDERSHAPHEPANVLQKVEVEKVKQDDALVDLSNILGELKNMAIDMGSEIERQNKALDHVHDDVEEINFRVKGANQRTRRLLGK
ncbi:hypothetical protein ABFS82_09G047700 [Erythranthe guttata]|uniref:t-SNARE coiled-coil homology domain-containing protein n=1 Tax=Erythranthe guttata TaxID=4155 RepID=A0A022QQ26_ERYGU|nr:PREDICTED: SNAP25 homologous protein SNAP33-like [Erythranthe guttata]EYU29393.1 hypothetical protein MIMGU_mgv1a010876mg [Erythranthe guttata]|eukprot:XP_012846934.1 PREDICTED: SNAP25 homologous protein SNAP33-like [Erythranthe guttata]